MILAVDVDQRGEPRGLYKPSHSTVRGDFIFRFPKAAKERFFLGFEILEEELRKESG